MNIDTTDPHSLSELESLSDSDWLDIASSRASDTDFDSDRDIDRPSSRRSFNSIGSSSRDGDGEVQAWEGFVDDPVDESPTIHLSLTTRSTALSDAVATLIDPGAVPDAELQDPSEDQRVKDALDQSMMSTLSSSPSRSHPNSLNASHASIIQSRDLRLSFPDPLTSSREELLNTSYEEVANSTETDDVSPGLAADIPPVYADAADPGAPAMPVVPPWDGDSIQADMYIVLYGSSSTVKWSFIDKLLEKIAQGTGFMLTSKIIGLIDGYVRFLSSDEECRIVSVLDRTGDDVSSYVSLDRPSLAVVFLPSAMKALPDHTLYLPVLARSLSVVDLPYSADQLLDAEQYWDTLRVSRSKVVSTTMGSSAVIDHDEIERFAPRLVFRALRPVLARPVRKPAQRLTSKHAWTILAVLSVVLGYAVTGSFTTPALIATPPQEQTTLTNSWGTERPVNVPPNSSASPLVPSPVSSALVPSLKDLALAVLPAQLSASTSGSRQGLASSTPKADRIGESAGAPSECPCGCGLITWPGKLVATTDLMLRPTPPVPALRENSQSSLSLIAPLPLHRTASKGKSKAPLHPEQSLYALSTKIAGSLSEYFDLEILAAVVVRDVQEILDALDELVHAIVRQTNLAWEQSKDTAHEIRGYLQERHTRARANALALRDMGGRIIDSLRGRAGVAKENARAIRESMRSLDIWKTPQARKEEASRIHQRFRERFRERKVA
ncbi:uncharacterized protein FIBRA_02116 [Fibroporia radiculosa]|uniref:Uncharacterized protein n=1 Tax=Fibroporia radiculosa TaxID=599839 RepID=J4H1N6_9APHY|nr:uncharacterized protein FIBRA_02116 [Fibroporia radiculosa]CCM00089.1 predicted protein [Fibroporia radiculosa]